MLKTAIRCAKKVSKCLDTQKAGSIRGARVGACVCVTHPEGGLWQEGRKGKDRYGNLKATPYVWATCTL